MRPLHHLPAHPSQEEPTRPPRARHRPRQARHVRRRLPLRLMPSHAAGRLPARKAQRLLEQEDGMSSIRNPGVSRLPCPNPRDNRSAPGGATNTLRGLTRQPALPGRGLGMEPTRVCESCSQIIARNPKWSSAHYATRRFCSRACQSANNPNVTRDYTITETGCWEWLGRLDRNGYGKAYDPSMPAGQRVDWAHRVSYRVHRGAIPEGKQLDHLCSNPPCINPEHLEPVTQRENIRRAMTRAGRDDFQREAARLRATGLTYAEIAQALELAHRSSAASAVDAAIRKGLVDPEEVPRRKTLDEGDREDIRALYALGVPQTEIGAWYGVDSSQISRICNGKTSGHTPRERARIARQRREAA